MTDRIQLGIGAVVVGLLVGFGMFVIAIAPQPGILGGPPCLAITRGDPATVAYRTSPGYDPLTGLPVPVVDVCDADGPGPAPETRTVAYETEGRTVPVPVGFAIGAGGVLLAAWLIGRRREGAATRAARNSRRRTGVEAP